MHRRHSRWLLALILVVLPATLRLAPIQHGHGTNYLPDTHVVRGALGMAKDKTLVPPAGKYSTYPYLLSYALLPVYATQYGVGRVTGEWANAEEYGNKVMEDPWRVHLPARILLALIAALAPLFVYLGLREAGLHRGAVWGAAFLAMGLLHIHYSVQERPWAPLITFMMACAWLSARFVRTGRYRNLVGAGMAAGLAVACHQGGFPAVLIPAFAWLWSERGWNGLELVKRLRFGLACATAFVVVAILFGNGYLFVSGGEEKLLANQLNDHAHFSIGPQSTVFGFRAATFPKLGQIIFGYDPAIVLLGLLGLWPALKNRRARPAVCFAVLWGVYFMTNVNDHARYLLPLTAGLCWSAGFAAERLGKSVAGGISLVLLAAFPAVQAVRFVVVMNRVDTRTQLAPALEALPATSLVAIDLGGPVLPHNLASLAHLAEIREPYRREAHRFARLQAGEIQNPGVGPLPLEDIVGLDRRHYGSWVHFELVDPLGSDLPKILNRFGVSHIVLVDTDPSDPRTPILTDELPADEATGPRFLPYGDGPVPKLPALALGDKAIRTVHPGPGSDIPGVAHLPMVMDFPITDLWRIQRPGPVMRVFPWPAQ